jgi:FAD/FMN-containing dehydrogenase/Fe-S oxidoreductase
MANVTVLRREMETGRFARQKSEQHIAAAERVDVRGLEADLRQRVRGEVRFDKGSRALYATDGSNYRQVPLGVVIPRDTDDVIQAVGIVRRYGAPLLSRGCGTSLAGQCCNVAVVMDYTKYMHNVIEIEPDRKLARVQPGCVLDRLRNEAQRYHLTFGPDPATHSHCTLGGMLGNNSCGIHSLLSANDALGLRASDNTHALEILTYDGLRMHVGETPPDELEAAIQAGGRRGEIYAALKRLRDTHADEIRRRYPKLPRRVSGYNLDELLPEHNFHLARALVGSESTCVVILEATLHLVHNPQARSLLVLGYPDVFSAGEHVMKILEHKPTGLEGVDHLLYDWLKQEGKEEANLELLPPGGGWLLVEFGADSRAQADDQARAVMEMLKREAHPPSMKLFDDPHEEEMVWKVRESGLGATAWVTGHPDNWPGWEDSAVPPEQVGPYLRDLKALLERYNYTTSLYGHLGQGCIHCRIPFDFYTAPGIEKYHSFMEEATDLVLRYGGSLSGEHGDGQARAEFLPKMFGDDIVHAFEEFKSIWDPQWRMNPGKIVDPYGITQNLRLGADYNPPDPATHFHYAADQHSFARAALRCVGVGECRREHGGTMCPSYMVTREEMHSTRGRARLLFEMLNGDVLTDGWCSEAVKEALDLCLACKGCKGDCPVKVDMATYKAEFLSHYYEGHIRPRNALAFGFIGLWSQWASHAPTVANFLTQTPGLRAIAKWAAGIEPKRKIPPFAPESFQHWFARRPVQNVGAKRVVLFPDTFINYFQPEVGKAAVDVLEHAGFQVRVPQQKVCCGRPLFDYGYLDAAKRWLRGVMQKLRPEIEAGTPMVVLEPSCAATFRDELMNLFPNSEEAKRLKSQTLLLSEFLEQQAPQYRIPRMQRQALLHGHCHQKAVMGMEAERKILQKMGLEISAPDSGCCGMAGAFGYERGEHYDVSIQCGERVLLPEVRQASQDTVIVADGFSCREQILQDTDREALHLAQVIQLAIQEGPPAGETPERRYVQARKEALRRANVQAAAILGASVLGGALLYSAWRSAQNRRALAEVFD